MRILIATVEQVPSPQSGSGLSEVFIHLAQAMKRERAEVTVVAPWYGPDSTPGLQLARRLRPLAVPSAGLDLPLWEGALPGSVRLLLLEHPSFVRSGVFGDGTRDWPDNAERFALFGRAVAALASAADGPRPEILHLHDWPTGLVPYLLEQAQPDPARRPTTVLSLYNLAYQGHYPAEKLPALGIPGADFTPERLEYFGHLNFLKAGLRHATALVAMGRAHALEILTPEGGHGMDGLLRHRQAALTGIPLGIDGSVFNPEHDSELAQRYSAQTIGGKRVCKRALQDELGLPGRSDLPLVGFAPPLARLLEPASLRRAIERIIGQGMQVVLLPAPEDSELPLDFVDRYPEDFAVLPAGDVAAYHRLIAGADLLVVPTHFTPGSQPSLEALRYGTLSTMGGKGVLELTRDGRPLGFEFSPVTADGLAEAVARAARLWPDQKAWRLLMLEGMSLDYSWAGCAHSYIELFTSLLRQQRV